jgi:hypothetical protein
LSIYPILALVTVAALSASALTFHYYRPKRKRSPEAAVAVFSAVLAAGAWVDSVLDRANRGAEREAEVAAAQQLLNSTLATADRQAARRDDVLASKIEIGFRKAGLEGPAQVVREVRMGRSPPPQPIVDVATVRRLAELETEKRLGEEQRARDNLERKADYDRAMRQLCALNSYKDTDQCRAIEAARTRTAPSLH